MEGGRGQGQGAEIDWILYLSGSHAQGQRQCQARCSTRKTGFRPQPSRAQRLLNMSKCFLLNDSNNSDCEKTRKYNEVRLGKQ
jgi:hypothetical protein